MFRRRLFGERSRLEDYPSESTTSTSKVNVTIQQTEGTESQQGDNTSCGQNSVVNHQTSTPSPSSSSSSLLDNNGCPKPKVPPSAPLKRESYSYNIHHSIKDNTVNFQNTFRKFGLHLVDILAEEIRGTPASELRDYFSKFDATLAEFASIMDPDFYKGMVGGSIKYFRLLSTAPEEGSKNNGDVPDLVKRVEKQRKKLAKFIQTYFMRIPSLAVDPVKCRRVIYIWYSYIRLVTEYLTSVILSIRNKRPSADSQVEFTVNAEKLGNELDDLAIEHGNRPVLEYDFGDRVILSYVDPSIFDPDATKKEKSSDDSSSSASKTPMDDTQYEDAIKVLEEAMLTGGDTTTTTTTATTGTQPRGTAPTKSRTEMVGCRFSIKSVFNTNCSSLMILAKEKAFRLQDAISPKDRMNIFISLKEPSKRSISKIKCGKVKVSEHSCGTIYSAPVTHSVQIPLRCNRSSDVPSLLFSLASRHFEHTGDFFTLSVRVNLADLLRNAPSLKVVDSCTSIQFITERIRLGNKRCPVCNFPLVGNVYVEFNLKQLMGHGVSSAEIMNIGLVVSPHDCKNVVRGPLCSSSSGLVEL